MGWQQRREWRSEGNIRKEKRRHGTSGVVESASKHTHLNASSRQVLDLHLYNRSEKGGEKEKRKERDEGREKGKEIGERREREEKENQKYLPDAIVIEGSNVEDIPVLVVIRHIYHPESMSLQFQENEI